MTASEGGLGGNVPAGAVRQFVDAALDNTLAVTNAKALTGGTVKEVPVVSPDERDALRAKLRAQLEQEAVAALGALRAGGENLYPDSVRVRAVQEKSVDLAADADGKPRLELRLEGVGRGIFFDGAVINQLAARKLAERGDSKVSVTQGSLVTRPLDLAQANEDEIKFRLLAQAKAVAAPDSARVLAMAGGKSASDAERLLSAQLTPLAEPPRVRLWPFWVTEVTRHSWRVRLTVVSPGEPPSARR